jgi:hypothetical protein
MRSFRLVQLERVAGLVGAGYLICALLPRVLSTAGVLLPLASFYWSLPGALLGCVVYAAWTGLRGRRQGVLGMVASGAAGVLASGFLIVRLPLTIRPFAAAGSSSVSFFGAATYGVLCDLSAIVFLFALFLVAYLPATAKRPGGDGAEHLAG